MALRSLDVGPGDRVAGIVANVPEAVVAMLATISVGAVWSSCSPDFGAAAILDRFRQIDPVVLFATTSYSYGGKEHELGARVAEVRSALRGVRRVVTLPSAASG